MDRGARLIEMSNRRMQTARNMTGARREAIIQKAKTERKEGLVLQKVGQIKVNKGVRMMYSAPYLKEDIIRHGRKGGYGSRRKLFMEGNKLIRSNLKKFDATGKRDQITSIMRMKQSGKTRHVAGSVKKMVQTNPEMSVTKIVKEMSKSSFIPPSKSLGK